MRARALRSPSPMRMLAAHSRCRSRQVGQAHASRNAADTETSSSTASAIEAGSSGGELGSRRCSHCAGAPACPGSSR
ncbi:hypothetical protein G6F66_015634 [Rhizopus arrhizus]|nr:hypothetical protein G6F66_015634 [Rhizopus arrhizus]